LKEIAGHRIAKPERYLGPMRAGGRCCWVTSLADLTCRRHGWRSSRPVAIPKSAAGGTTADRRDEVLLRYGLPAGQHPDYQIDHLIPLCLGGSDDFSNLWPQPRQTIEPKWNAEAKDRLEHLICAMVCNGQLDIATAQQAFAKDWIAAYHKYYAGH
jgi:hypothetical protein